MNDLGRRSSSGGVQVPSFKEEVPYFLSQYGLCLGETLSTT
jgi:hypothetical protein